MSESPATSTSGISAIDTPDEQHAVPTRSLMRAEPAGHRENTATIRSAQSGSSVAKYPVIHASPTRLPHAVASVWVADWSKLDSSATSRAPPDREHE